MSNYLRPLRPGVFQVVINDAVAAILSRASLLSFDVYILTAEVTVLAKDVLGSAEEVALRIASGTFDNDFRFDIGPGPDEDGNYWLEQVATPSQTPVYSSLMRDPYGFVAAERQCQAERRDFPELEDRLDYYAEIGL